MLVFRRVQILREKRGCTIQGNMVQVPAKCEIVFLKLPCLVFAPGNLRELDANMRLVILCQITFVSALKWNGPKSTGTFVTASSSPRPAEAAAELIKRDAWPASYCGFVGGIESKI
jgi:hypothetical protein